MNTVPDVIKKEIVVNSTLQKTYAAIAEATQVVKWFPDAIEGDYAVGAEPILNFGPHGKTKIKVTGATPYTYFAYRWVPGADPMDASLDTVATTLVEFTLAEVEGGVKVTVTESGFASLPIDVAQNKYNDNNGGWDYMLGRLVNLFA